MKKTLTFFLMCMFGLMNAQVGTVTYTVSNNMDKVKKYFNKDRNTLKDKYLKKTMDDIYGPSSSVKTILKFTKSEAIYKVEQKLQNDSNNNLANKLLKSIAGGDNVFYINLKEKKTLIQDCKLLGECFIINMPPVKWSLTQQQKKIGSYNCFLAKATYKTYSSVITIEAWYTLDIPANYGPMGIGGLPGLILELKTNKAQFTATDIVLNPKEYIKIKKPKRGKEVTSEKFESILKKSFPEFYRRIELKRKQNN